MKNDEQNRNQELIRRITKRIVASWLFYSNSIKPDESTPWKVVRYEHIVDPEESLIPLARTSYTRPKTFEEHLRYYSKHCHVVPLASLLENISNDNEIRPGTIAITLDGGWFDNYHYAAPLLTKYYLPASFFLPTAFINTNNMFWNDKVAIGLMLIGDKEKEFPKFKTLGDAFYDKLEEISPANSITPATVALVQSYLQISSLEVLAEFLVELGQTLEEKEIGFPELRVFMSWDNVETITRSASFSFWSLTHSHRTMSTMNKEGLASDLRESFLMIEEKIGNVNKSAVATPYGDFDVQNCADLAALDIKYLLTNDPKDSSTNKGEGSQIIGRTSLFQDVSYCKEILACRLWHSSTSRFRY